MCLINRKIYSKLIKAATLINHYRNTPTSFRYPQSGVLRSSARVHK
jgi:hypothetical protein